jgi:hypothetical protein
MTASSEPLVMTLIVTSAVIILAFVGNHLLYSAKQGDEHRGLLWQNACLTNKPDETEK